jgi:hypothetical protein
MWPAGGLDAEEIRFQTTDQPHIMILKMGKTISRNL